MRVPTDRETAIFEALVQRARPILLQYFTPDSCIASTRIALDALAYFGVAAREYPLLIAVFNAEAAAMLSEGMAVEDLAAHLAGISPSTPGGPWSMGIGLSDPRVPDGAGSAGGTSTGAGRWSGHLIVGAPQIGVVADLSADQAARAHKGLDLKAFWARVEDPQWFTDPQARHLLVGEGGVTMVLDRGAVGDREGYTSSANWRRRTTSATGASASFKPIVGEVMRAMRADLGE